MSISHRGFEFATVRPENISLRSILGGYWLNLTVWLNSSGVQNPPITLRDANMQVHVARSSGGPTEMLGNATTPPKWEMVIFEHSTRYPCTFEMPVSASQLEAIERLRGNDGLRFECSIGIAAIGAHGTTPHQEQITFQEPMSKWVEMLNKAGAAEYLMMSMPIPLCEAPIFENAVQAVRRAHRFYLEGHYNVAVSECRSALAVLKQGQDKADDLIFKEYQDNRRAQSKVDRMAILRAGAIHLTHLAHHSEGGHEVFSRSDACLVLGTTIGVLNAAVEQYRINKNAAADG